MSLRSVFRTALGHRGLGFRPEQRRDTRDRDFVRLGLSSALPAAYSLRAYVPDVLNQLGTESCVVHAILQAIRIRQSLNELPCPLGSRLYLYFNARAETGDESYDLGTYIRSGLRALTKEGLPDEKYWPFDLWKVNRRPSWNAGRMAAKWLDCEGYYRIFGSVDARLAAIKAAIASGRPVVGGWTVSQSFLKDAGPELEDVPTGAIAGNHAMVLTGYRSGDEFDVLSSWGDTWRDQGFTRMTADYVLSGSELYVINL